MNDQPKKPRPIPFHILELEGMSVLYIGLIVFLGVLGYIYFTQVKSIVVYVAQDQVYAEPLLKEFTRQTGIKVKAVFDSEAVKTVGLANRLLAEKARPQCDLFWSNEEFRTRQLVARGVFNPELVRTFGYRTRRLVINTNLITMADAPRTLIELTNQVWNRKVALAYPLFGSTSTHFMALRQHWGTNDWNKWCRALMANRPFLVDGNSIVVKLVGAGEAAIGLTDWDDISAGIREGLPIAALPLSPEMMLIPNTTAIVQGAPNQDRAHQLAKFITSDGSLDQLASVGALEGIAPPQSYPQTLKPDWNQLLAELELATAEMQQIFLRK